MAIGTCAFRSVECQKTGSVALRTFDDSDACAFVKYVQLLHSEKVSAGVIRLCHYHGYTERDVIQKHIHM